MTVPATGHSAEHSDMADFTVTLDFRPVRRPLSGVARYCLGLAGALSALDDCHLRLVGQFAPSDLAAQLAPPKALRSNSQIFGPSRSATVASNALLELGPPRIRDRMTMSSSIVHETYFARLNPSRNHASHLVATVHDTIPLDCPEWFSRRNRKWSRRNLARQANEADLVIAVSEFTKKRVLELTDVEEERVFVIPNAIGDAPGSKRPGGRSSNLSDSILGPSKPTILHVGNIEPRKNLVRLARAVADLRKDVKGLRLVLVGHPNYDAERIINACRSVLGRDLVVLGHVSDEARDALLDSADLVAFPSIYEGFGIPVLEAYARRVPIIFADNTAMRELAVEAQQMFDPYDCSSIAAAAHFALTRDKARNAMIQRGYESLSRYQWPLVAEQTMSAYRAVLSR